MQITHTALFNIISHQELEKKLKIGAALTITRRHFCSQMTASNLCSKECSNCAAHILKALSGLEEAGSPQGMYVNHLRNEYASIAEKQEKPKIVPKKDKLGIPVPRNDIFEDLLLGVS
jgi:hypothetical protein